MSMHVPASFQTKYQNNVEMKLQQSKSQLMDAITWTDDASADKVKVTDVVGNAQPNEADERHGDTKYANTEHDGIWLPKKPELYYAELVDNADKLQTGLDLEGLYVNEGAAVVDRGRDRRILEGVYGNVISGKEGTIVTPFPASQIVPVNTGATGPTRMNTAKLRAANKNLAKNHVDKTERKYMVLTAEQSDDLLSEVPATSSDFAKSFGGEVDENGFIRRMLGWNFLHMELDNEFLGPIAQLSLDASGYRKNPFWVKSGIRGNFWQRLRTSIDPIPTKLLSRQVFAGTTLAATRTQAGKVGIILNSEEPA